MSSGCIRSPFLYQFGTVSLPQEKEALLERKTSWLFGLISPYVVAGKIKKHFKMARDKNITSKSTYDEYCDINETVAAEGAGQRA